jgi:hypothetical protein
MQAFSARYGMMMPGILQPPEQVWKTSAAVRETYS